MPDSDSHEKHASEVFWGTLAVSWYKKYKYNSDEILFRETEMLKQKYSHYSEWI